VMVFLFFGLMATCGTAFVMAMAVPAAAWWCGIVLGFLAVAILLANNLRDIPSDATAGKRTLAVRLGDRRTRTLYRACVVSAFATIVLGVVAFIVDEGIGLTQWGLLGLAGWIPAIRPMEVVGAAEGRELVPVLSGTAAVHATTGVLLALGLVLARTA
jgi:1,4-dihydroxy-2-naphthoate octaprenyltransferase